jgi:transcriptional regulator of acetoin/glycerol metabolism
MAARVDDAPAMPAQPARAPAAAVQDEAVLLGEALRRHRWNVTAAAAELGVCRATVYRQMKRFRIVPPNQL